MTDKTVETDVVVVGAGPAGAVLGHLLSRSGVQTLLLERHSTLEREFRGFGFQPSTLRIFDDLGVLDAVLALDHERLSRLAVEVFGTEHTVVDFTTLPAPHDFLLSIRQPPLLRLLIDRSAQLKPFEFRDGTVVRDLLVEDGTVVGVRATDREANTEISVRAPVVVGADGRFSTVRSAAGIDPGLIDTGFQVVWFKLPGEVPHETQFRLNEHGLLLYFGLGDAVQLGLPIIEGTYPKLREAGIAAFREHVGTVDPRLRGVLESSLADFGDCSLLDGDPGFTEEWARDGLVLVGDAAHVASPVGGQGNALALQDVAVLHSHLVRALDRTNGPITATELQPYVRRRQPAVRRVLRAQLAGHRGISALLTHRESVPNAAINGVFRALFGLLRIPPVAPRLRNLIALGPDPVRVETGLLSQDTENSYM